MKKILIALTLCLAFGSAIFAAGASSPITGFSWDNVRKVVRMMTSDGQEIQVAEAPKTYTTTNFGTLTTDCTTSAAFIKICHAGISALSHAALIPYRTTDGKWRLRFNISYAATSATAHGLYLSGVTFAAPYQTFAVICATTAPYTGSGNTAAGSNVFNSYCTATSGTINIAGDVELLSKPVWAD